MVSVTEKKPGSLFALGTNYYIPLFQRPFSWEPDNFQQFFDDIFTAAISNEQDDYFLGTILLLKRDGKINEDRGDFEIIDGQQRITALIILFAVIRDLLKGIDAKVSVRNCIIDSDGLAEESQSKLIVKEYLLETFRKYVITDSGTINAIEAEGFLIPSKGEIILNEDKFYNDSKITEPERAVFEAIDIFLNGFGYPDNTISEEDLKKIAMYIRDSILMVRIVTDNLPSAFRLFNVINSRGLPLTNSDLLKSDNISFIKNEDTRSKYTRIWEQWENDLGDDFDSVISYIRTIKAKASQIKTIYDDYNDIIFKEYPSFKGERFIEYVDNTAKVFNERVNEKAINIANDEHRDYYRNLLSIIVNFLPFSDWIPPFLFFCQKNPSELQIYNFLVNLEKNFLLDWVRGLTSRQRATYSYNILKYIEDTNDKDRIIRYLSEYRKEENRIEDFRDGLDSKDFYRRSHSRMARYVLLRINMELHNNPKTDGVVTTEHILPRKPSDEWMSKFEGIDGEFYWEATDKLGNLTPLEGKKNSRASNRPYEEKLETYLHPKGTAFWITERLDNEFKDWNLSAFQKRHEKFIEKLVEIMRED